MYPHVDDMKKVKGVPYHVEGDKVVVFEEGKDPVSIDLVLGKSTYQVVHAYLFSKTREGKRPKTIGNFTFHVENDTLTVFHKNGNVLGTKELVSDSEVRYPRRHAIEMVLEKFE